MDGLLSRKLAFRLELELSFRNSTGGLGVAWAQVATRGPVFVFGIPVSSVGLFLDSFVFRGHVFTCPLSSAGVSLDCLYFVFHHGFVFGSLLWAPWWSVLGLHFGAGGPFWGSVLVPVVRLGVSV